MIRQTNDVFEYIQQASQLKKKMGGKKEVPTSQMIQAAISFKTSIETAIIEWKQISEHITTVQEICRKDNYTKDEIEFLIEFLELKCDSSVDRVIQTKTGGIIETVTAVGAFMITNSDLSTTINNYKYWILVLKQVLKTL